MRQVKAPEERRNEILDVALALFRERGFDKTSINDILLKVGIAKGTLYYHFPSKEAIMDALIERYMIPILQRANEIACNVERPVIDRLFQLVFALKLREDDNDQVLRHMHQPQNALLHQKTNDAITRMVTPFFVQIIEDGIREGLFQTPYAYECMEMLITYANTAFDHDKPAMTTQAGARKTRALFFNIERLLGAKEGSLTNHASFQIMEEGAAYGKE